MHTTLAYGLWCDSSLDLWKIKEEAANEFDITVHDYNEAGNSRCHLLAASAFIISGPERHVVSGSF